MDNHQNKNMSYTYDFRKKVMEAIDRGESISKISKTLNISRNTIYLWKNLRKDSGDIKRRPQYHRQRRIQDLEALKQIIQENNSLTGREISSQLNGLIAPRTVYSYLKLLGHTYKKNLFSSKTERRSPSKI